MIILNFSHDIHPAEYPRIAAALGVQSEALEVRRVPTQLQEDQPFEDQVERLLAGLGWSPEQWETTAFAVALPGFSPITAVLLPMLHALSGHFPLILRFRQTGSSADRRFELAEVIDLQAVRNRARQRKSQAWQPQT